METSTKWFIGLVTAVVGVLVVAGIAEASSSPVQPAPQPNPPAPTVPTTGPANSPTVTLAPGNMGTLALPSLAANPDASVTLFAGQPPSAIQTISSNSSPPGVTGQATSSPPLGTYSYVLQALSAGVTVLNVGWTDAGGSLRMTTLTVMVAP
jgi:hypothetical protein